MLGNNVSSEGVREWLQATVQVLAFLAAISIAIYQQGRNDKRAEADRRRKYNAVRASLPLTLARIDSYSSEVLNFLLTYRSAEGGATITIGAKTPLFPTDVVGDLRSLIENSDEAIGLAVSALIRFMQIHNSRLNMPFERGGIIKLVEYEVNNLIYDTLCLRAMTSKFYDFARNETDRIDAGVDIDDINRAARLAGVDNMGLRIEARAKPPVSAPPLFFRRRGPGL